MHLYLSSRSPWNATYSNAAGQIIYQAEHPRRLFSSRSPITVRRVLPNMSSFPLAEIDYHTPAFCSPHIRYNGIDFNTNEYFSKTGFLWRNRTFRAPDGKQYEWHLGSVCKLYLKDSSNALVASHRRRKLGFIGRPRPASLEIFPQGLHMVDLILITYIFVEKLQDSRNKSAAAAVPT